MIMFTKVFQFRHPDLSANAYKLFLVIALIIFMEVIGIFYGSNLFWIVFLIGYGFGIILFSFIFYFSNQLEIDKDEVSIPCDLHAVTTSHYRMRTRGQTNGNSTSRVSSKLLTCSGDSVQRMEGELHKIK